MKPTEGHTNSTSRPHGPFFTREDIMEEFSASFRQVRYAIDSNGIESDTTFGKTLVFKRAKVRAIGRIINKTRSGRA